MEPLSEFNAGELVIKKKALTFDVKALFVFLSLC